MRIAFAIVKLFQGGGLQRDCVEIARAVARLGHEVTILTAERDASDFTAGLDVSVLPARGATNHRRQEVFSAEVAAAKGGYDLLVGFNKLAGLDVLKAEHGTPHAENIRRAIAAYLAEKGVNSKAVRKTREPKRKRA